MDTMTVIGQVRRTWDEDSDGPTYHYASDSGLMAELAALLADGRGARCMECGTPASRGLRDPAHAPCRLARRQRQQQARNERRSENPSTTMRRKRIEAGLCRDCGKPRRPDRTRCDTCLASIRQSTRQRAATNGPPSTHCGACGEVGHNRQACPEIEGYEPPSA